MGRFERRVAFVTDADRRQGRSHVIRLAQEGAGVIAGDICSDVETVPYPGAADDSNLEETVKQVEASRLTNPRPPGRRARSRGTGIGRPAGGRGVRQPRHRVRERRDRELRAGARARRTELADDDRHQPDGNVEDRQGDRTADGRGRPRWFGDPHVLGRRSHRVPRHQPPRRREARSHRSDARIRDRARALRDPRQLRSPRKRGHPDGGGPGVVVAVPRRGEGATREQAAPGMAATNALPVPWIDPVDVTNAVLYVASDEARYVTGTTTVIDAGAMAPFKLPHT
jgi:NAD(P)-dependent dehydrogenase (short-subunit alcohol dehydrogenase family)